MFQSGIQIGMVQKRDCLSVDFRQKEKLLNMNCLLYRKYRIIRKCFSRIYYEDMEKRVRKNTMITKKNIIEIKIRPYFDELRLCDITPKEVMRWQNQM